MAKVKKKTKPKEPSNNDKSKPKPFKCKVCNKAFSDHYNLHNHAALHKDESFPCLLCPYKGKTKKYLSRHHRQVHTERNQHKCTYCGKFFLHPSDLRDHIMVHTGEKPLSCNVCGKSFRVTYSLNTHMLIHTGEKPFRCSFCDYSCRDSSSLRKHQNKHMGLDTVYQCKICSKRYKSKWKLKMHVAEAHLDVDVRKVQCGQCDMRFKTVSQRNGHVKSKHNRLLACTCPVCGLRLASKYNLSDHMRRHMEERPFACTHPGCELAFKNKGCLSKHAKIHEPPLFECSYCGRKFVRKSHVAQHELVMHVQRARNVQCDYCGTKFYSKNYLLKHIQTKHVHKQKFKFTCDICGLTTHNKPSIVMHLKYGHTNDDDLQCKLCDNKVVYKKHMYLKSHYWKSHNVKYKIDARRTARHNIVEETKPNVQIKVEPIEADSYEGIQLLDVEKVENASEDDNESLDYSKQVLSEDLTALVLRNSKEEDKEVDFDDFYIRHIMAKQEEKPDDPKPSVGVNKEQDQYVKRRIKHILIRTQKVEKAKVERKKKKEEERLIKQKEEEEVRIREELERQEIIELRRVRELYNAKMKLAKQREVQRKEKVNIKYFKKKPEVNKVTVIDDDLDKECTENDTTTNKSVTNDDISDNSGDDDDNTPLTSLVTKINSSVNSTNNEDIDHLKKNSDNSALNDKYNDNLNTTEVNLSNELNEINTDTENMDIDDDLNSSNIVFIEGETFIDNNEVKIQMTKKTNDLYLSGHGDRVQNSDVSHNKNYADGNNLEKLGSGDLDHIYIRNDEGNNSQQNNYEKDNVDKNHDHTYVKNNYITNNEILDKQTTVHDTIEKEVTSKKVTEGVKVIENDQTQSDIDSGDVENAHGLIRNDNDENNDENTDIVNSNKDIVNSDKDIFNNDENTVNSDKDIVNNDNEVINDDNESSNSDSDFDQPLIERKRKRKKITEEDLDYEDDDDDKDVDCKKKAKKMEFKTHQCYVCFKLYQTKKELINHCQEHFDMCNERTLSKCPICNLVSYKLTQHMRHIHKVNLRVPFNKLKDRKTTDGSRYCYEIDGGEIDVIPSIKILNKTASMEIDKKRREKKDKTIATTKLVKKGNDWIVEKEYLDLKYDELPELTDIELTKCKVTGNDIDRLGQISRLAKKKGLKMMFPCFECDKVCQNFSALKLHKRRHEVNPKPFAPRIKNGMRSVKKEKVKLNKSNRTALPKPIKTNHKCDEKLKEFFKSNIRGGDIEFWQFLKIFNKMDREKVNDFKDLEERSDFGNHLDYYKDDDNEEMVEMAKEIDKYIGDDVSEIDEDDKISEVIVESGDDD